MFKIITTLAIGALGLVLGSAGQAEQFTYGTYFKATHNIIAGAVKPYFDEVTKKTDGALTFKFLTDGTVVGAATTTKGVQQGLVDMGTVIPIYSSSVLPMTALFSSLPLFKTDSLVETGAINELFFLNCDECQPEWANSGITPLAMYGSSPYYLQCAKPVDGLDDLKGKRIQGTGEYGALATAFGGQPMGLTGTELYTGMSQGTLDCVLGAAAWLDTYGLKDVVKYVVDVPMGVFRPVSQMNMNTKKWNRLTKDQRKVMIDGLAGMVANSAYEYVKEDEVSRAHALAAGVKFVRPFDGFMQIFTKVGTESSARFVELASKKGMKDPQRLLDRYLELEKDWSGIVANAKSRADYEAALRDRIFSKVKWSAQ